MIIKLLIVEVTIPSITPIPSVLEMTVSTLCENASGNKVRIDAAAVIKMGLILERLPLILPPHRQSWKAEIPPRAKIMTTHTIIRIALCMVASTNLFIVFLPKILYQFNPNHFIVF
jgi:hypothetical protein